MRILISNDDGIQSIALRILAQELVKLGNVYISAPSHEQSGVGHGITAHIPLRVQRVDFSGITEYAWGVDGTPADCVKLAIEKLMPEKPDIVISGINYGANLGTDVIYSGTVAAAMEGFLFGLPAIAISATGVRRGVGEGNFLLAATKTAEICRLWQQRNFQPRTMLNINVPGHKPEDVQGCRFTKLGWRWY
ncbi:MAG: 5'/3'-nucleotidase SurE, partial [Clostridiales bacterium]